MANQAPNSFPLIGSVADTTEFYHQTLGVINKSVATQLVAYLQGKDLLQDKSFTHTQGAANTIWNVAHNLGKHPVPVIIESGGNVVEGDITYVDTNNLTLTFSQAISGTAYLN